MHFVSDSALCHAAKISRDNLKAWWVMTKDIHLLMNSLLLYSMESSWFLLSCGLRAGPSSHVVFISKHYSLILNQDLLLKCQYHNQCCKTNVYDSCAPCPVATWRHSFHPSMNVWTGFWRGSHLLLMARPKFPWKRSFPCWLWISLARLQVDVTAVTMPVVLLKHLPWSSL